MENLQKRFKLPFKTVFLLLLTVLVFGISRARADDSGLFHIGVNDRLLDLSSRPVFLSDPVIVMLPYYVFTELGATFEYSSESGIASIYDTSARVDFDMRNLGQAYDALGSPIEGVNAILSAGQIYLPTSFISDVFGFKYTVIAGVGYGNIIRVTSVASLDDKTFLSANTYSMREWYNSYIAATPAPTPSATPRPDRSDTRVYLTFRGLPTEETLRLLRLYSVQSCFFITTDDVRAAPDMVRSLIVSGHLAGVLCTDDNDYFETADLIFEAAKQQTLIVSGDIRQCTELTEQLPIAFWRPNIDIALYNPIPAIEAEDIRADVQLSASDTAMISNVLAFLQLNRFSVQPIRETDVSDTQ